LKILMGKRAIGIDIGPHHIRAVQMTQDGDRLIAERVFAAPMRRSTDQPSDIMHSLASRHGFDWRADVAVAMPAGSVFYRDLAVQTQVLEQIRHGDVTPLAESMPIPTDQMIAQICSQRPLADDRHSILVAATTRTDLEDQLNLLAHVHPKLVDAEAFAIWNAVLGNYAQAQAGRVVAACVEASHLTLVFTQDGQVTFVRSIPWNAGADQDTTDILADSIQVTFQKVFGGPIDGASTVYLVAGEAAPEAACQMLRQSLGCPVTAVDPFAKVVVPADQSGPAEIAIAMGLAIRALAPRQTHGVDFLAVGTGVKRSKATLRREMALCGTLICAIGMVWLIGLWTQFSCLESHYSRIKGQMTDLFRKTLPEERHIVSPLAQVQQRLDRFQRDYRSLTELQRTEASPMVIMDRLGATRQDLADVLIHDLLITADQVRLKGSCRSFEQVYQWQRRLEAIQGFTKVQVEQPTRDGQTGQVSFTILIGLTKEQEQDHDRT